MLDLAPVRATGNLRINGLKHSAPQLSAVVWALKPGSREAIASLHPGKSLASVELHIFFFFARMKDGIRKRMRCWLVCMELFWEHKYAARIQVPRALKLYLSIAVCNSSSFPWWIGSYCRTKSRSWQRALHAVGVTAHAQNLFRPFRARQVAPVGNPVVGSGRTLCSNFLFCFDSSS